MARPGRPLISWAFLARGLSLACCVGAAPVLCEARAGVSTAWGTPALGKGGAGMSEAESGLLLLEYFQALLGDQDMEAFRGRVAARYNEGTLARILAASPIVTARRAAVLSLGILGTFDGSNAVLGRALRDEDPGVRSMAEDALWSVWFRADTPENNRTLAHVRLLIGRQELDKAVEIATRLIAQAPNFAEAYNQRALAYFLQGRLGESALDCERVLSRNPFHIGAISGLAKCQLGLNRPFDALKTLRRLLKLQPHSQSLRETIKSLEAEL